MRASDTAATIFRRRLFVLVLNAATIAAFLSAMVWLLSHNGLSGFEAAMLVPYALTLPWLSIGFWNGVIGLILSRAVTDPASYVNPHLSRVRPDAAITSRTAVAMALRNEDPDAALARLEAMQRELSATPWASQFDFHVLSDSSRPEIAAREEYLVELWQARAPGARICYRRRTDNSGFKAGNIMDFLARWHREYDFYLPLDADSFMTGAAVLRLVRVMQASPAIGILQGLVVGAPSKTFFTRAFQFGMRHGMRSFTLGSAWWQADCGPYWGHNALVRAKAFHDNCQLPVIAGRGPLAGHIMSHDQVEAVLIRRAGYEVRVLAEEDESFEQNPPSIPDFIKREIRWCQGNMQYLKLLAMPGLKPVSRIQLVLAIIMYLAAPSWILFVLMGAALAGNTSQFVGVPAWEGLALFVVIMAFNLSPKIAGLAMLAADRRTAAPYGGRGRLLASGVAELVFSTLVAPIVAVGLTICCLGLMAGRRVTWDAQQRSRDGLSLAEAARGLWPQTVLGLGLTGYLGATAPWALAFGAPVLLALSLAIPIGVYSTRASWGQWTRVTGLFDIPEDRQGHGPEAMPAPENGFGREAA